jgi:acyl-CoA thioester hydrolase
LNEAAAEGSVVTGLTEIRVRVADTDLMGVVYNSNYLVWFEIGRTELLRARGTSYAEVEERGFSLPVTEAQFKVRRPARYDDLLTVETKVEQLQSRKVVFSYRVRRGPEELVEGRTVHIPVRHAERRAVPLPDWLRAALV